MAGCGSCYNHSSKDHYIVFILGWYPASQNANQDTDANATTSAFKKHLFGFLGDKRKETLVYWADCWQFCHVSKNESMNYDNIKKSVAANIEMRQLCVDLLAINLVIAETICTYTPITWVLNGEGETHTAFLSIFLAIQTNGNYFTSTRGVGQIYNSNTERTLKLYVSAGGSYQGH
jgi:hypothetical protein